MKLHPLTTAYLAWRVFFNLLTFIKSCFLWISRKSAIDRVLNSSEAEWAMVKRIRSRLLSKCFTMVYSRLVAVVIYSSVLLQPLCRAVFLLLGISRLVSHEGNLYVSKYKLPQIPSDSVICKTMVSGGISTPSYGFPARILIHILEQHMFSFVLLASSLVTCSRGNNLEWLEGCSKIPTPSLS